ncbi:DNA repair protein RAD51 [Populus alba x Populus x berolinensis]|nr:DNA repair protein RAD51 [Populus alba x Populus x berolinensis]
MDGLDGSNAILQQEQQQQSLNPKDWIVADPQNAWDLLHEERSLMTRLTTSCADLDDILGGGISCKQVTEIGGVPGIGKTQLGIQLAVNVQMPSYCGGLGGKAIYIDTEGSFMGERAQEIAEACVEDISEYKRFLHKDLQACQGEIHGKDVLQNIYFFRICSYTEQIALINYLEEFISDHKDVKIVIIDSVAFHFRQGFEDLALRTRILGEMALKLVKLAKMCNLAVTNICSLYCRFLSVPSSPFRISDMMCKHQLTELRKVFGTVLISVYFEHAYHLSHQYDVACFLNDAMYAAVMRQDFVLNLACSLLSFCH